MLQLNIQPIIKSSQSVDESSQAILNSKNEFVRRCQLIPTNKPHITKESVTKMTELIEKVFSHIGVHSFYMYNTPPVLYVEYDNVKFVTLKIQYNHRGYIEFHFINDGRIIAIINTTGIPMEETLNDTESAKKIVIDTLERFGTRNYNYQQY
jgi:hypothetical protein